MTHFLTRAYQYTKLHNYKTPDNILKMTSREKAEELIAQFKIILMDSECNNQSVCTLIAKECAKLSVRQILSSNPHSNPFNTEPHSTFEYWYEIYNLLSE